MVPGRFQSGFRGSQRISAAFEVHSRDFTWVSRVVAAVYSGSFREPQAISGVRDSQRTYTSHHK